MTRPSADWSPPTRAGGSPAPSTASSWPCGPSSANRSRSPGRGTVVGRLVESAGDPLPEPSGGVSHLFPTPAALLAAAEEDPSCFAMPASRRRALVALATAVDDGSMVIDPGTDRQQLRADLVALPGVGPWTAEYVSMRALRDPDTFLPSDLGIRRAAAALGLPDGAAALGDLSEAWRPWRSYAMAHLWSVPVLPARRTSTPTKGHRAA